MVAAVTAWVQRVRRAPPAVVDAAVAGVVAFPTAMDA